MRWTQALIPTLKEAPAEAEILSHKLLLRAGLLRKLASGVYTFLPLGLRALNKVSKIVREEMDRAGALEVLMPALQPPEIWQQSGRYETATDVLYRLRDHQKREWVLGPTHEEVITTLAAGELGSYRQLPKNFYQIQVKFRDEIRPRFGLMRAREFIMKDAYSFDTTDEGAMASYKKMYDAYTRIFARCGLQAFAVEADTGVIGGNYSHEFMVPAETGENDVVYCEACGYAANIEKATSGLPATAPRDLGPAPEKFATPGVVTIEALSKAPYSVPANRQIKTLVYIADSQPVIILVRGDDQMNETKFMARTGAVAARPATPEEIVELLGAKPGSLGAVTKVPELVAAGKLKVLADERLREGLALVRSAHCDRRRTVPEVQQGREDSPRDRGGTRLQARHEIQREAQRDLCGCGRLAETLCDGLLRHRRHPHAAGDHRAEQRQGRHHLAVERRALHGVHHSARGRAGIAGHAARGKSLRRTQRGGRGCDHR